MKISLNYLIVVLVIIISCSKSNTIKQEFKDMDNKKDSICLNFLESGKEIYMIESCCKVSDSQLIDAINKRIGSGDYSGYNIMAGERPIEIEYQQKNDIISFKCYMISRDGIFNISNVARVDGDKIFIKTVGYRDLYPSNDLTIIEISNKIKVYDTKVKYKVYY